MIGQSNFLDVERSVTGRSWTDRLDAEATRLAGALNQRNDLSEILARVVAGRGVTPEDVGAFLNPTLRELMPDPSSLTDMDKLAGRLADAIEGGEGIALF